MLRSMFSAISGLRNHQVYMDVIGNNIANVNTTGYRASRVTFQDILSQTIRGASSAQNGRGAVNANQVGLGTVIAGIDSLQTQGNLQASGKPTDLAIQGDGFFVVSDGTNPFYTRDGAFDVGSDGRIINTSSGFLLQGWMADPATNAINTAAPMTDITIPVGQGMTGSPTSAATIMGNLDASNTDLTKVFRTTVSVYDSLGVAHQIQLAFQKTATANQWTYTASTTEAGVTVTPAAAQTVSFTSTGTFAATNPAVSLNVALTNGATMPAVALDMSKLTQLSSATELNSTQNGVGSGSLVSFTIGAGGDVVAVYSNGQTKQIGQIAMANFPNPTGLVKDGNNVFSPSASSGDAQVGTPESGGRGKVNSGFLEMSNVDLAQQFTNMIVAQRGFQANSRVITASDEMLQEVVNLKR
jgi:flagellar hook protein FlgE